VTFRRIRVLLLCIVAILLFYLWFQRQSILDRSARFLILSEPPQHADLILVLAGDFYGGRVFRAAQLAGDGYAPVVLISGTPYQGRSEGYWAIEYLSKHGHSESFYAVVAHEAKSTVDEAVAVCPELKRRAAKRVLLATSAYHSRRADIVFRMFCPGIDYISTPGDDPHYDPARYRTDPGSEALFKSEWRKIFGTIFVAYPEYLVHRITQ
jgi:uncharacterized SAM-binding protein YcdF (DUF218 family)